ncbi:MAG: hypothetical protein HKN52_05185 [Eudoraea sp.]|nr:hypothetical protein [Eudoraea sp.]
MKINLLFIVSLLFQISASANCADAYASASYSLSHTKKSLNANNFDHQQYSASRALEAFEKSKELVETCGCESSMDAILDGIENLESSLEASDWDMGRYYAKRALANAQDLLGFLDMCSSNNPEQSSEDPQDLQDEGATAEDDAINMLVESETDDLEMKINFQRLAEINISELERAIHELALLFECDKALNIINNRKDRTEEDLKMESFTATKAHYVSQTVSIHNKALFALLECSKQAN